MSKMFPLDAPNIYACVLLGAFAVSALCFQAIRFARSWTATLRPCELKFLRLPLAVGRHKHISPVSRGTLLAIAVFLASVIAANAVGITNKKAAGIRAGTLCVINLAPMFLATQFSFAADSFGSTLDRIRLIHRTLGAVCFFEALSHVILNGPHTSLRDQLVLFGMLAAISICLLGLGPIFRNVAYESVFVSHIFFTGLLTASLWLHLVLVDSQSRYFVLGAAGLLLTTNLYRLLRILFHNMRLQKGRHLSRFTRIKAEEHQGGLVKITISLTRAWQIRPGQHVYLQVPLLNLNSWFQSHPFVVVSWAMPEGATGAKTALHQASMAEEATILTLILSPQLGWTSILLPSMKRLRDGGSQGMVAFVDGPYGGISNVGDFGTVLMFATGMGIFGHIPYIGGLLNGYNSATVRTKRIRVVWQTDRNSSVRAKEWMDRFLERDQETLLLDISLYYLDATEGREEQLGQRLRTFYGQMDCDEIVNEEFACKRGGVLVSVSAESRVRDEVRCSVGKKPMAELRNVKVAELDFQPGHGGQYSSTVA